LDGLHRKAGIPSSKQAEIHGCIFREKCEKCGTVYTRKYDVVGSAKQRYTGMNVKICKNLNEKKEDCAMMTIAMES
jgi:NAD-dependent SIR2 family protein deacetylase